MPFLFLRIFSWFGALCLLMSTAHGAPLNQTLTTLHHPVPGGVAVIEISPKVSKGTTPDVRFQDKRVLTTRDDTGRMFAIVGIPLPSNQGSTTSQSILVRLKV